MMKINSDPENGNLLLKYAEISREIDELRLRMIKPAEEKTNIDNTIKANSGEKVKKDLVEKISETPAVTNKLDHDLTASRKPNESVGEIFEIMDQICHKLNLPTHTEQIARLTTGQIIKKIDASRAQFIETNQLNSHDAQLINDYVADLTDALRPDPKNQTTNES